ncbi:TM2 domain-containing protein [Romboutsia ilealis]|uniref:TM2 domain-containing protein n=1 Tax=Romboutsia ilealis TaxID=1115758 RepID=UPI0028A07629|nr:TM2 domain-containing protein [Romboutsia ilealis]
MYCKECGEKVLNKNAVICVKCGTNKGKGRNFCKECGEKINNIDNQDVCLNCGVSLNDFSNIGNKLKEYNGKGNNKKILAGILALFLGSMGIHRLYLGYKEIGFIQLGLFLIGYILFWPAVLASGIWAIIDTIQIFTGKLYNANGEILI